MYVCSDVQPNQDVLVGNQHGKSTYMGYLEVCRLTWCM